MAPSLVVPAFAIGIGLSAIRATTAGNGLDDFDLFAGTGVLDKVPDVDDAIGPFRIEDYQKGMEAGAGAEVLGARDCQLVRRA